MKQYGLRLEEMAIELQMFIIVAIFLILVKIVYDFCIKQYMKIRNANIAIDNYKDINELNRDINIDYSPAVLSYLMDKKTEKKKDILATLLNLYSENIIDISKENDKYVFKKGQKIRPMYADEFYLYLCVTKNQKINIKQWEKCVQEEFESYGFSKEKESKKHKSKRFVITYFVVSLIEFIIAFTLLICIREEIFFPHGISENITFGILLCGICMPIFNISLFYTIYTLQLYFPYEHGKLTTRGKKEIKKWLKFKKFIEQYTLIEERDIEETKLFEKYIPYAMALNINQAYKNKELNIININEFIKYAFSESVWFEDDLKKYFFSKINR